MSVLYKSKVPLPVPMFIAEAGLFIRTRPGLDAFAAPDLQYHFSAGIPGLTPPELDPLFGFVPILTKPQSRGRVTLRSASPATAPVVQPNYLDCDTDVEVLLRGIQLAHELAATKAFVPFNAWPDRSRAGDRSQRPRRIHPRACRHGHQHPVGTCKMGRDAEAVVDPQLRVHGVAGLRVADASIMPVITAGNTNAACMMIGEKAADLILAAA